MPYECEQTVANTCESITNNANGLRIFIFIYLFIFFVVDIFLRMH